MTDHEQHMGVTNRNNFIKRKKRKRAILKEQLHDYGVNSTLHGLRYVTDRHLSIVEKIFWFTIFSLSVGFCIYRINTVWIKWRESPVLVTFNERLVNVGSVPFPSVTICPAMKTKASKFNYTDVFDKIYNSDANDTTVTKTETEILEDLMLICNDKFAIKYYKNVDTEINRNDSTTFLTVANLLQVAPSIDDAMMVCLWRGKQVRCTKYFKTVLTAEGVCFNMNSIQAEEMFHENNARIPSEYILRKRYEKSKGWDINGYYDPNVKEPYPRRGQGNGAKSELMIYLLEKIIDHDDTCNTVNNGFMLYIQHPSDMPSSSMHRYAITPDMHSSVALKFNILTTAENIRHVPSETRQCFFPDERPLRYFKIYTASNCNIECLTNITYKLCNCVGFYMPREIDQKICTVMDLECMKKTQEELAMKEANYMYLNLGEEPGACNCLPSCNTVDYDADVIKSNFNYKTFLKSVNRKYSSKYLDVLSKNNTFSLLSMYYKQPRHISMRRSELYGITDFLANCGGLLGLFLGFSFLSLVEIIYFLTLRLWCTLKREAREEKQT